MKKNKICVKKGWGWVALCANLEPPPEYMLSKESKVQPSVTYVCLDWTDTMKLTGMSASGGGTGYPGGWGGL